MKILMINRSTTFSAPGGDTIQMQETANSLRSIGVEVDIFLADQTIDYRPYDLIHFFNIIRPNNISKHVKKSGLPFVISTIFVDYSETDKKFGRPFIKRATSFFSSNGLEYIKTLARRIINNEPLIDNSYLFLGHKRSVERLLQGASMLLPNSDSEYLRLKKCYSFDTTYRKIPNAVNEEFCHSIPSIEKKGIICVARIEPLKNQLNLIEAMKGLDVTLKIIGKPAPNHTEYYELCKFNSGSNVSFLGQLDRNSVIDELDKAKVHVLPSWFETTGLSTLEAAARNCSIVITKKGDTEEYFGSKAWYCEPDSPSSIREAIISAMKDSTNLNGFVKDNYIWRIAAEKTYEVYKIILRK